MNVQWTSCTVSPRYGNTHPIKSGTAFNVVRTFFKDGELHHKLSNRWEIPAIFFTAVKPRRKRHV